MPAAQEFRLDEMFYSRTDAAGRIRSGNGVFTRVSGYAIEELRGRPHNIVRHPDMPRSVFALFWQLLGEDRAVAAYVQNRAKDGSPYWVMATAFPVSDGFLSIRIAPSSPLFDEVRALYRQTRDLERRVEADAGKDAAISAGLEHLTEWLASRGYENYPQFMLQALAIEATARQDGLDGTHAAFRTRAFTDAGEVDGVLQGILEASLTTYTGLLAMVGDLGRYGEVSRELVAQSSYISSLSEDVRVFSFNALFASDRLGRAGVALAATAALMQDGSHQAGRHIAELTRDIRGLLGLIDDLRFRIATTQMRTEMTALFVVEVLDAGRSDASELDPVIRADLHALTESLDRALDGLVGALQELDTLVGRALAGVASLGSELDTLKALQINGRVEAARVAADASVTTLFATIGDQVRTARERMQAFAVVSELGQRDDAAEKTVRATLESLTGLVALL